MKEEGLLNCALSVVKQSDLTARFLTNQTLFNGSDNDEIDKNAKVGVIFALNVLNEEGMQNQLEEEINEAHKAQTLGEIREVISNVYDKMPEHLRGF